MRNVVSLVLALISIAISMPAYSDSRVLQGKVVGVSDGDTITILAPNTQRVRVRLAEIDAPESAQDFGSRAKQALSEICFGKMAEVTSAKTDRYGRVVGRVFCGNVNAQTYMVHHGMAWVYDRHVQDLSLYSVQEEAKAARRGIWAHTNPVPPWEFRRASRAPSKP